LAETRIQNSILHYEALPAVDSVPAERQIARAVADLQTLTRLEPLPVALDERDAGKGHTEGAQRNPRNFIEALLRLAVDCRTQTELHQSLRFVLGNQRFHHLIGIGREPARTEYRCYA